jgi:Holliday junction resolvase-like predicted endonuclease
MTTETLFGPSEKQISFISALIDERQLTNEAREGFRAALSTMDKKAASILIDTLLTLPKAPKAEKSKAPSALQEALSQVPKSKYAVPAEELDIILEDTNVAGDLIFIEVREYMNTLYMRRLLGSIGGFTRVKLDSADTLKIVQHIAVDPYKYTKLFGLHYSCCGSCGAELTDQKSRELQLGPECRKKFGK